jgi:aquaporin Z
MVSGMTRKLVAEMIGTAWLVLAGCGAAVLAGAGIGLVGISFAFGLSVVTMAYAIGPVSGCHLNPAVTVGLAIGGRFEWRDVAGYIGAQLVGAVLGAAILYGIASGMPGFDAGGFAANGTGDLSPNHYSLVAGIATEVVMTFFFVLVILGVTRKEGPAALAPLAIGLALVLVHLVSIPITNTSVNPARSTSQAVFAGGDYLAQLWTFWVAPLVGAALAGLASRWLFSDALPVSSSPATSANGPSGPRSLAR